MAESYIQSLFAERIGGSMFGKDTTLYKFEKIKRAKRAAKKAHPEMRLIDMGVGEPDEGADKDVVARLAEEAGKKENRFYSDNGIQEFKDAAIRYLETVFGVTGLNAETDVNHAIGSKPALALLPLALMNKGDVAIMTVPGYPVFGTHTKYLGGEVHALPLTKENDFFPDLKSIPKDILTRAKAMVINYPNNPTGKNATREFYETVIAFAKENNIVIIQDAAYAALVYNEKPLSFLSVPGAKDVGIEIHSLSKAYNMTGWRLAFVVGNPLLVKAFATVKDNSDSGQFIAIQKAGVHALEHPEITERTRAKYERRLTKLVTVLKRAGFSPAMPDGTFYLYLEAPKGTASGLTFDSGEAFSQYLIKEKLISTVPWDDAGNFVRFSATFEAETEAEEDEMLRIIEERLTEETFVF